MIASADFDNSARLWEAATGEPLAVSKERNTTWNGGLDFVPDGSRVSTNAGWTQFDTGYGRLLDTPEGNVQTPVDAITESNVHVQWLQHGRAVQGGTHFLWNTFTTNGDRSRFANCRRNAVILGELNTGKEILIGELSTGKEILRLSKEGISPYDAAFDRTGTRLVSGSLEGVVTVWSLTSGVEVASWTAHAGRALAVDFSPDGTRIATGGDDGNIVLWDAATFERRVMTLKGHQSYVHSVRFSPDGTQIASGSGDGTVRIWDSLPISERHRQVQAAVALREKMAPLVDRLLEELTEPKEVAERLRGDSDLDEASRRAALRVLLHRTRTFD